MRKLTFSKWFGAALVTLILALGYAHAEDAPKPNTVDLVLVSFDNKNQAIRAVHNISGISLADSKDLVEKVPKAILAGVSKEEADKAAEHAKALTCTVEIRAAQPGAAPGPVRKFELVLVKAGPSLESSEAAVANVTGKETAARNAVRAVPVTLASGLLLGEGDKKAAVLEAAGCTAELVSSGGVETGGVTVTLTKIDTTKKIVTIATVREHTGLSLARAKALVETLPHAVKIKISQDEAAKIKAALEGNKATVTVQ